MVWKQDLAKLKKELKEGGEDPGPPKPRQPAPKPDFKLLPMENEDALFLAAMGQKAPRKPEPSLLEDPKAPAQVVEALPVEEDFASSMAALKGMKRPTSQLPGTTPTPKAVPPEPAAMPSEAKSEPMPEVPAVRSEAAATPVIKPEAPPVRPSLIHLAAGMAIEVDGSLDLRGHNSRDAMERLAERVLDGACLGWRTLHVILGASDELRTAFLTYVENSGNRIVSRYAQAPIPMGGSQAWILYYAVLGPATRMEQP